ncbi:hypothetical protein F2Q69_00058870 [Brassica cretica]|uniref:Uncharacterized protein n=1 Tax=Brassica cretica TaxID=69181 RepID=A0A8S9RGJ4_BRACR|nr:hypothetical protein F2Q69_00058870 [Brassica cretica]
MISCRKEVLKWKARRASADHTGVDRRQTTDIDQQTLTKADRRAFQNIDRRHLWSRLHRAMP